MEISKSKNKFKCDNCNTDLDNGLWHDSAWSLDSTHRCSQYLCLHIDHLLHTGRGLMYTHPLVAKQTLLAHTNACTALPGKVWLYLVSFNVKCNLVKLQNNIVSPLWIALWRLRKSQILSTNLLPPMGREHSCYGSLPKLCPCFCHSNMPVVLGWLEVPFCIGHCLGSQCSNYLAAHLEKSNNILYSKPSIGSWLVRNMYSIGEIMLVKKKNLL